MESSDESCGCGRLGVTYVRSARSDEVRIGVSCGVSAGANALSNMTSKPSQQAKESLVLESAIYRRILCDVEDRSFWC